VAGPSRVARVAPRDVAPAPETKPPAAGADEPNAIPATVKPTAPDATPLGALWARLPKGGAARGAADAREAGERGDAREQPEAADAPKRPKLEFPDDF
jgi:hypothetical protein